MESQRVKLLTEGYLRGWLCFKYTHSYSRLREEIILSKIEEDRTYELLHNKLFMETVLRSTLENKTKSTLDPIFDTADMLVGLKLPSLAPKDKIKKDKAQLDKDDLAEWKKFLDSVNKK